jgi:hypothetical protein
MWVCPSPPLGEFHIANFFSRAKNHACAPRVMCTRVFCAHKKSKTRYHRARKDWETPIHPHQRIKSFCGAKPPQKLGWTNAGRWGVEAAMEISPRTLGAQVDDRGSIDAA